MIRQDIEALDDMLTVNIKWSKTRQYGHSRQMPVIAMPDHCLCPVTAYKAMVSTVVAKECDPTFCIHSLIKKPNRLVPPTYAQFQAKLRELISGTGRDENLFSPHSIRRGSCSWAFKSRVKSELIQHHGGWVSECYKEYLTYDFHQKLSVSQKMCSRIVNDSYFFCSRKAFVGDPYFRLRGKICGEYSSPFPGVNITTLQHIIR